MLLASDRDRPARYPAIQKWRNPDYRETTVLLTAAIDLSRLTISREVLPGGGPGIPPLPVAGVRGYRQDGNNRRRGCRWRCRRQSEPVLEEATMDEHFVWMTTRQIKPGSLTDFERAWRPDTRPEGTLRAYAYWSEDEQRIVGVSFWASKESCEAWRASRAEARRREAMAPYVVDEQEAFYLGRELGVPAR